MKNETKNFFFVAAGFGRSCVHRGVHDLLHRHRIYLGSDPEQQVRTSQAHGHRRHHLQHQVDEVTVGTESAA
jgi:hypothetical protein